MTRAVWQRHTDGAAGGRRQCSLVVSRGRPRRRGQHDTGGRVAASVGTRGRYAGTAGADYFFCFFAVAAAVALSTPETRRGAAVTVCTSTAVARGGQAESAFWPAVSAPTSAPSRPQSEENKKNKRRGRRCGACERRRPPTRRRRRAGPPCHGRRLSWLRPDAAGGGNAAVAVAHPAGGSPHRAASRRRGGGRVGRAAGGDAALTARRPLLSTMAEAPRIASRRGGGEGQNLPSHTRRLGRPPHPRVERACPTPRSAHRQADAAGTGTTTFEERVALSAGEMAADIRFRRRLSGSSGSERERVENDTAHRLLQRDAGLGRVVGARGCGSEVAPLVSVFLRIQSESATDGVVDQPATARATVRTTSFPCLNTASVAFPPS